MGLNMLRCHIKVPDPRNLEAADETGMLVRYEIPVWNDAYRWTPEAAQRGVDTFHAEVERDWNHPSIVIQSIMNEQWGMDSTQANQRAWLLATFRDLKQLTAPLGRLIDDDSACCKGFHLQSDLADWHTYYSIPDHAKNWADWVQDYASRPKWLLSPYGDAIRSGHEPLWYRSLATGVCPNYLLPANCPGGSRGTLTGASLPALPESLTVSMRMALTAFTPITLRSLWPWRSTNTWP
jgi:hypothetical protein